MGRATVPIVLSVIAAVAPTTTCFSASPPAPKPFGGILDSLFKTDSTSNEREELKMTLVEQCRQEKPSRERIEVLITDLAKVSPTPNAASSPRLQKTWILEWTTEKEINVFQDWKISGTISQTIDGTELQNMIPFRRGGSFEVTGKLSVPDPDGIRTDFEFESATLDLARWGSYNLPPVGKGWFDTLYLDDNFRVDINSRDDILICSAKDQ